jgi:hypothetical protein
MAVIIKGKSISCSQRSRDHYLRGKENEKITVLEVLGFATKDADEALSMIELSAKGSRCKKPLYSAKINPEPGRVWTKPEVERAIEILEQNLGLTGHARVVVEHQKHGRIHYHVLWDRFQPGGGPAVRMSNDYAVHQKTQRQIEKEFGLKPMMAKGRDFKDWEVKWAKRYGFDIFKLREQITKDFNGVKSGQEFMAALKAKGVVLCRGDKSQFVVILPWGQHKALSSMIYGRPTKAVLRRALADIDIKKLPTVAEGKTQVKATLPKIKRRGGGATRPRSRGGRVKVPSLGPAASASTFQPIISQPRMPTAATLSKGTVDISAQSHQPEPMPHRPISRGGMGAEQLTDYIAACDGKITWRQYFMKWGNLSL